MRSAGPYQFTALLGQGGMGAVYRARHPQLPVEVAVKVLKLEELEDPEARLRFRAEVSAIAQVQHPNVVPVIDAGRADDGTPYYVMPLIVGASLDTLLRQGGPLPAALATSYVSRIARAVHAVHTTAGALHRDLKPSNVIVDEATGEPRLFDFGLARSVGPSQERLTRTGTVLGTPEFMAPEQALGDPRDIDVRTDVYGLGALLYALLTGEPPIPANGQGFVAVLRDVVTKEPTRPEALRPDLPRDLAAIVVKALHKDRAGRYESALALALDLERHERGLSVRARPPGRAERLWRRARAAALPFAGGLIVAAAAVAAAVAWREHAAPGQAVEPPAPPPALATAPSPAPPDPERVGHPGSGEAPATTTTTASSPPPTASASPAGAPATSAPIPPAPIPPGARAVLDEAAAIVAEGADALREGVPRALAQRLVVLLLDARAQLTHEAATLEVLDLLIRANIPPEDVGPLLEATVSPNAERLAVLERTVLLLEIAGRPSEDVRAALARHATAQGRDAYLAAAEAGATDDVQLAASLCARSTAANDGRPLGIVVRVRALVAWATLDPSQGADAAIALCEIAPRRRSVLLLAASLCGLMGDFERALALARRGQALGSDSTSSVIEGEALLGLGRLDEARGVFERVVREQDSFCARAHLGLCRAAVARDEPDAARATWRRASAECFDKQGEGGQPYNQDVMSLLAFARTLAAGKGVIDDPAFAARLEALVDERWGGAPPVALRDALGRARAR